MQTGNSKGSTLVIMLLGLVFWMSAEQLNGAYATSARLAAQVGLDRRLHRLVRHGRFDDRPLPVGRASRRCQPARRAAGAVRRDHARHQRREPRSGHRRARRGGRRRRHAPEAGHAGRLGRDLGLLRRSRRPPMGGRPQSRLPDRPGRARPDPVIGGLVERQRPARATAQPIVAPPAAKISASHEPALLSRTVSRIGVGSPTRSAQSQGRSRPIAAAAAAPTQKQPGRDPGRIPAGTRIDQGDPDAGHDRHDEARSHGACPPSVPVPR